MLGITTISYCIFELDKIFYNGVACKTNILKVCVNKTLGMNHCEKKSLIYEYSTYFTDFLGKLFLYNFKNDIYPFLENISRNIKYRINNNIKWAT